MLECANVERSEIPLLRGVNIKNCYCPPEFSKISVACEGRLLLFYFSKGEPLAYCPFNNSTIRYSIILSFRHSFPSLAPNYGIYRTKASKASYSAMPNLSYSTAVAWFLASARCQNSRSSDPGNRALSFCD